MRFELPCALRPSLALVAVALLLPACDKTGGGRVGDAAATGMDTGSPEADARSGGTASDAAGGPSPSDRADATVRDAGDARASTPADVRGPEATADLRGSDLVPAADGAADRGSPDLPTAADAAAGDAAPLNNGSVTGLTVVAANTTVGLDWPRVADASKYRVYWATTPGVSRSSSVLESAQPAMVHRGLSNGTAYYYAVAAVTAAGEGDLSAEATATPGGEWVLEELGTGDFDEVLTGGRVSRLAVKDRIHIVLLGEGYLEGELGKLHDEATHASSRANDVDRWIDEVFRIEPYSQFRPAFVIWFLPRASQAHLGAGATAFGVTVSSGSVATVTAAAAPLFSALDATGSDAFAFPPSSPVVNHVAAFLLYDSSRGRAGISGLTTTLQNPNDRNQRIGASFGIGHAHEFTHAFASLRDEYFETTSSVRTANETANTSPTNTCSTLPWAHLIAGAGINTTDGLVGAFGTAELGYHPELKCLLNGTHDNGQILCQPTSSGGYASLTLRTDDRMCNFCREITTYRVFEHTRILSGTAGFATWKSSYRAAFYQRYGFEVPSPVPQTLKCPEDSAARPVFQACVP